MPGDSLGGRASLCPARSPASYDLAYQSQRGRSTSDREFVWFRRDKSPATGEMLSQRIGAITLQILGQARVGGLFLTGGDIATAVANALGAEGYRIQSEVAPCIPCGTFINSELDDLPVITKAGDLDRTARCAMRFIILRRCIVGIKTIAITMGDPAGLGQKLLLKPSRKIH